MSEPDTTDASSMAQLLVLLWTMLTVSFTAIAGTLLLLLETMCSNLYLLEPKRDGEAKKTDLLAKDILQAKNADMPDCSIYSGVVRHHRLHPVKHRFQYNVSCAVINLDDPPEWFISSSQRHHMSAAEARAIANTAGTVLLLTNPVSVGYEQNPISVYYCFRPAAAVTNTPWGERVTFAFDPNGGGDMRSTWRFKTAPPGETLRLSITAQHPQHGNFFVASLDAKRLPRAAGPASSSVVDRWRLWLMPQRIA
eukprot:jgi/Mesen1/1294/ME000013S00779